LVPRAEYAQGNSLIGIAELIIAKNKTGQLADVLIQRNRNFTSYTNYYEDVDDITELRFFQNRLDEINEPPF
jgi:hypothetical protein